MKALSLVLALFVHVLPAQKPWVVRGDSPEFADARVVTGTPELNPEAARQAAIDQAIEDLRTLQKQRGIAVAAGYTPSWVPERFMERVVEKWVARQDLRTSLEVLDQDQRVRDHGFGQSYQASVLVRANPKKSQEAEKVLGWEMQRAIKRLKQGLGITCAGWIGLAFLVSWLDRLSRGYMTLRLWALACVVGVAIPAGLLLS